MKCKDCVNLIFKYATYLNTVVVPEYGVHQAQPYHQQEIAEHHIWLTDPENKCTDLNV